MDRCLGLETTFYIVRAPEAAAAPITWQCELNLLWYAVFALHPVDASETPMPRDCRRKRRGFLAVELSDLRCVLVSLSAYGLRVDKAMHDRDRKPFHDPFDTCLRQHFDNIDRPVQSNSSSVRHLRYPNDTLRTAAIVTAEIGQKCKDTRGRCGDLVAYVSECGRHRELLLAEPPRDSSSSICLLDTVSGCAIW